MKTLELIDQFGKEPVITTNYSDLVDNNKLARHDFQIYKQGYDFALSELKPILKGMVHELYRYCDLAECDFDEVFELMLKARKATGDDYARPHQLNPSKLGR